MNRMSCLVLDDEPVAVRLLAHYIQSTPGLKLARQTSAVREALTVMHEEHIDLLFLDIQMPEMNGLDVMNFRQDNTSVIFTTAYRDFAVEGFEKDAVDYLLKPITYERFLQAVSRAQKRMTTHLAPIDHLFVKTGSRLQKVNFQSILFIEASRDYIVLHTREKKIIASESMNAIETLLPETTFLRIHRSYLINKHAIDFFEKWHVDIGGLLLPVSESYRDKLLAALSIR